MRELSLRFRKTGCLLPVLLLLTSFPIRAQEKAPSQPLKIGLVLSGGGARGLAHIGVLRWCEEHRIPVDYISGTSMGGLIGGLYATGMSPDEMLSFFKGIDWKEVFDVGPSFNQLAYRRREDRRAFQSRFELGLKEGLSLPAGLSSAHYIGLLIDRMTLPYSTLKNFDELPIPFRCLATDFLKAESVDLRDGSLGLALRATMAIPGVFPPVERDGRILVDGGLLNNIPTNIMRAELKPDVVIAVDNGTQLADAKSIASVTGVLAQAVTVMTIDNDRRNLRLADVIIAPELGNLSTLDFENMDATVELGYQAAVQKAAILERFALEPAAWEEHLARRHAREHTTAPVPDAIQVAGVEGAAKEKVVGLFKGYLGRPLDLKAFERDLTSVIGEGRYQSLGYSFAPGRAADRATLLINVVKKPYAPPTLNFGIEIDGADVNDINFTLGSRITFFDVGGYGSEWRNDIKLGFRSLFLTEYFKPLNQHGLFVAPRAFYRRERQDLFVDTDRVAQYQGSEAGAGIDIGVIARRSEFRLGYEISRQDAGLRVGLPVVSTLDGRVSLARVRWAFDGQNSATVPTRGVKLTAEGRWYFAAPGSTRDFAQGEIRGSSFTPVSESGSVFVAAAFGTSFNRQASFFQQFTLGGPFNLGAYNRNEFRGNHYALAALGYLHRIGEMPPIIGGRISAIGWYDVGNAFNQFSDTRLHNGATIGVILDTKLGPVSLIGSFAEGGRGKVYFTFGKFF